MKKEKAIDRQMFKKKGQELQDWLNFTRRGSKVPNKKAYNRKKANDRKDWQK